MDREGVYSFLSRQRYGVISSISSTGLPQSALVGIAVTHDLEIVFDTVKASRKYLNLVERRQCSLVAGWSGEQTVQLEGAAEELAGAQSEYYLKTYFAAWPDGPARLSWPGICHFVVHPRWVRYSDYDRRPPLIYEINTSD